MTTSRQLRLAGGIPALAAIVVTVASCRAGAGAGARAGDAGVHPREQGGELTRQLHAGAFDSLPAGIVLDLGGDGDTVLVRWFTDRRRDALGREWPDDPVLELEGLRAGADFVARLEARYGREVELVISGRDGFDGLFTVGADSRHAVRLTTTPSLTPAWGSRR